MICIHEAVFHQLIYVDASRVVFNSMHIVSLRSALNLHSLDEYLPELRYTEKARGYGLAYKLLHEGLDTSRIDAL